MYFPGRRHHAGGDGVAAHDAAEDVDQDALHLGVGEHQLEGLGDLLGGGAAADVEEVGRLRAEQLDGVHGGHGQAGAIHQATDVAVEGNVGQVELGSLDLGRVLLIEIAHGDDILVAEQRVRIEVHLGIERHHAAVAGEDQRIDLGEAGVGVPERLVQPLQHAARLRHGGLRHADLARDVVRLGILQAGGRVDEDLVDLFWRMRGNLFDVHAALARSHQADPLRDAIHHHADVEFLLDVRTLLDQQAPHLLAFRPGLVRLQLHAEDLAGVLADFIHRFRHLDAAALAAAAGMDLRLDHPDLAAEFLGRLDGLVDGKTGLAARRGDPELPQDLLALVFMDFHVMPPVELPQRRHAPPWGAANGCERGGTYWSLPIDILRRNAGKAAEHQSAGPFGETR